MFKAFFLAKLHVQHAVVHVRREIGIQFVLFIRSTEYQLAIIPSGMTFYVDCNLIPREQSAFMKKVLLSTQTKSFFGEYENAPGESARN